MSRNVIFVLMYHHHKLIYSFYLTSIVLLYSSQNLVRCDGKKTRVTNTASDMNDTLPLISPKSFTHSYFCLFRSYGTLGAP
jgi:hypothetical protein